MRDLGSIILWIVAAVVIVWIALKLIGLAFHLLFLVLAVALGVFAYFVAERLVGQGR